jgi:hypothetical protein
MLYELLQNAHQSQVSVAATTSTQPWFCEQCVVLVSNIHGSTTAHGWTVTLTDETGATLTGWLQPESVRKQLQQPQSSGNSGTSNNSRNSNTRNNRDTGASPLPQSWFKTGCVWWLQNTTLFLSPESSDTETLSYLLLIGEDNIRGVWEDGASLSDQRYFEWMKQRHRVAVHDDDLNEGNDGDHENSRGRTERRHHTPNHSEFGQNETQTSSMEIHRDSRRNLLQSVESVMKQSSAPATRTTHQQVPHNLLSFPHQGNPHNAYSRLGTNTQHTPTPKNAPPDYTACPPPPDQHSTGVQSDRSPFGSFACAETESTLSELMDSSKQVAVHSSQSLRQIKDDHNTLSSGDGSTSRTTMAHATSREIPSNHKDPEQPRQTISQVATNTPPASQNVVESTGKTTVSSRKGRGSSSRKRRKNTDQSKLWTNTTDLDFSDESDKEIMPRERRVSCDTEAKETTPGVKKSLFSKADEFANMLPSDEDDDDE